MLDASRTVLAILAALPNKKLAGKKRLQKTAYVLKAAGAEFDVDFELWHYGVFSKELANATNDRKLYKCFEPPKRPKDEAPRKKIAKLLTELNEKKIRFIRDTPPVKSYKQFDIASGKYLENILVWSDFDDDYKPVVDLAPSIGHFADKTSYRFYFPNDADAETAKEIWSKL